MTWAQSFTTVSDGALTVCLQRNAGVISGRRLTGGAGFDYAVSQRLAEHLALDLEVVWIENELEEDSNPLREAYAVLSYELCDAVPGHPRYVGAVGEAQFERASLPRWLYMPREIDPETGLMRDRLAGFVDTKPISVTVGYMRSEIGMAFRDGTPEPGGLDDLGGRSLFVQQGTLSGAIAMMQIGAEDRTRIKTRNPGARFLWEVESKGGEVALVNVIAFDTHRKANPFTELRLAKWRHVFGMDLGFAVRADNPGLLAALDAALADMVASDELPELARAEGLTYFAPLSEALAPRVTRATLLGLE